MVESGPAREHGILLTVAYDGSAFSGFARQNAARTIAGELDGAVRAVDPRASLVRGSIRTDAGVHAYAQKVAFDAALDIPPKGWVHAIGPHLPSEIAVVHASRVASGFEPRHHCTRKTYRYLVLQSDVRDPFLERRAWRVPERLNHGSLEAEARTLLGEHDFAAFRSSADARQDTVRRVFRADVRKMLDDPRVFAIEVEGDRFMYRMVRIIAGTLVDVARGRLAPGAVKRAIAEKDRRVLGITAPPEGLYLAQTELDDAGHDGWPEPWAEIDGPPIVA